MERTITDIFGQQSNRKPTAQPETDNRKPTARPETQTEIFVAAEQEATTSSALQPAHNDSDSFLLVVQGLNLLPSLRYFCTR